MEKNLNSEPHGYFCAKKELKTDRLCLRPFTERYITPEYVAWLNDPVVTRYSDQRFKNHTLETCRDYVKSFVGTDNCFWAIFVSESERHVGNIAATVNTIHRVADVSILIGDVSHWGKGIGSEAWGCVCRYLFDDLSVRKITAGTLSCNSGMLSIIRHSGMQEEGRRIRQHVLDGKEVDVIYFGIFQKD